MPGFERAASIDRPVSQVYATLDDIQGARNWMPAIRRIEVLTPELAMDVGFRWRETRKVMGIFRMSAELEVTDHDAPKVWGLKYEDKKMRATARFELAPSGTGTLITLREEVTDLQGKHKRAERTAKWMEKADDDLLLRLKAHVESQPPRPEPALLVFEPVALQGMEPRPASQPMAHRPAAPQPVTGRPAPQQAAPSQPVVSQPLASLETPKPAKKTAKKASGQKAATQTSAKRAPAKASRPRKTAKVTAPDGQPAEAQLATPQQDA